MVLIDSYSEANKNVSITLKDHHPSDSAENSAIFQSFKPTSNYTLTSCKFYLYKLGSPTGNANATLYAHTGTFGSGGKPTGSVLATSDALDISTLGAYALVELTFSGAEQYSLVANTEYCKVFEMPSSGTVDGSNGVYAGADSSSPTHEGNGGYYVNGAWSAQAWDTCFYVYGDAAGAGLSIPVAMHHYRNLRTAITVPRPKFRFPKLKVRTI